MSVKSKVIAGAATLALLGATATAGALTAGPARAATPSCGPNCLDLFSKQFGTFHHPAFVLDVQQQSTKAGTPIILFRTSNSDPAEDFTVANEGSVSDFYVAGLVSPQLALHYGCGVNKNTGVCNPAVNPATGAPWPDDYAFEIEYSPYGVGSGMCAGVASVASAGEKVTLQPCGVSADTTWIADTVDSCPSNPLYFAEVPAINGSSMNFSHPFVMTYPAAGFPTDTPRPQLFVNNLTGFSQSGGTGQCGTGSVNGPNSNMLWSAVGGVLP